MTEEREDAFGDVKWLKKSFMSACDAAEKLREKNLKHMMVCERNAI